MHVSFIGVDILGTYVNKLWACVKVWHECETPLKLYRIHRLGSWLSAFELLQEGFALPCMTCMGIQKPS